MNQPRRSRANRPVRAVGAAGLAWGTVILAAGPPIWRRLANHEPSEVDEVALRVLGARHVATGTTQVLCPRRFQRVEIAIDLIHASSMVALAALDPSRRRPALVTAAVAVAGAAALVTIRARAVGGLLGP